VLATIAIKEKMVLMDRCLPGFKKIFEALHGVGSSLNMERSCG
jgi:hypothetical protein